MNGPGTLVLTASNADSGGTTLSAGTLLLDFSAGGATGNLLPSGGSVAFGGGTLQLKGAAGAQQPDYRRRDVQSRGRGHRLDAQRGRGPDARHRRMEPRGRRHGQLIPGRGTLAATPTLVNNVVPYATVAGSDCATTSGGNVAAYSAYAAGLPASGASSTLNYSHTGAASVAASESVNTLKLTTSAAGQSLAIAPARPSTIAGNGLLMVGGNGYTISGGSLTAGNGVGG